MADKALFTVGVFAGIINIANGKLLLRRRTEEGSIIPGKSFKGCWELPGGGVMDQEKISYAHLSRELEREVREELSIEVFVDSMPFFYPVPFKGPKGYDLALVTPIMLNGESLALHWEIVKPKGEVVWVSPSELDQLAKDFVSPDKQTGADGSGLLSGWGKRMHCMALAAFEHSGSIKYILASDQTLFEIKQSW